MNPLSSEAWPVGNEDYKDGQDKKNRQLSNSESITASQSSLIFSRVLVHE